MSIAGNDNVIEKLDKVTCELVDNFGYNSEGVSLFREFLQIDGLKNVRMCNSCIDNRYGVICSTGIFKGAYGQKCLVNFVLLKPFMIVANFLLLACSDNAQKAALVFTKKNLGKQSIINNVAHAKNELKDFEKHLSLVEVFFKDMHNFLLDKVSESQGEKIKIVERELFFVVPWELRALPEDGYTWLMDRPKSFFTHN